MNPDEPNNLPDKQEPSTHYLVSRNIYIARHRTSIRLEPTMWAAFVEISQREKIPFGSLCTMIFERKPKNSTLTAAIRVFIANYFRVAATEEGHKQAGHGNGSIVPFPTTLYGENTPLGTVREKSLNDNRSTK